MRLSSGESIHDALLCSVCGTSLGSAPLRICRGCDALTHEACADRLGGCVRYSCHLAASTRGWVLRRLIEGRPKRPPRPAPRITLEARSLLLAGLILFAGGLGHGGMIAVTLLLVASVGGTFRGLLRSESAEVLEAGGDGEITHGRFQRLIEEALGGPGGRESVPIFLPAWRDELTLLLDRQLLDARSPVTLVPDAPVPEHVATVPARSLAIPAPAPIVATNTPVLPARRLEAHG